MRVALPLLALASLIGCTNDTVVPASLDHGTIVFTLPANVACVDRVSVTDGARNELWASGDPADGSAPCVPIADRLLRYGADRAGAKTMKPARPLTVGTSYALVAGPGSIRAAFRYNGPTTPPTNFVAGTADWCAAQYPGSRPSWGQCVAR